MKAKKFRIKVLARTGVVKEYITIVDAEDAPLLRSYFWTVLNCPREVKGEMTDFKYVARIVNGVTEYLHHRIVGAQDGEKVWHINADPLDNRKTNLMKQSQRVEEID